jgi:hypothetical protein
MSDFWSNALGVKLWDSTSAVAIDVAAQQAKSWYGWQLLRKKNIWGNVVISHEDYNNNEMRELLEKIMGAAGLEIGSELHELSQETDQHRWGFGVMPVASDKKIVQLSADLSLAEYYQAGFVIKFPTLLELSRSSEWKKILWRFLQGCLAKGEDKI